MALIVVSEVKAIIKGHPIQILDASSYDIFFKIQKTLAKNLTKKAPRRDFQSFLQDYKRENPALLQKKDVPIYAVMIKLEDLCRIQDLYTKVA